MEINYLDHPLNAKGKFLITEGFVNYDDYFNAGVLLMNIKFLKEEYETILNGVKFLGEHPQCDCFDQDILNYLFSENYIKLPERFDVFVNLERKISNRINKTRNAIYHYVRNNCTLDMSDWLNRLWFKYFMKTPWFDIETIGRLCDGFSQGYRQLMTSRKNSMVSISAIMSGKTRAFFILPQNVEATKEIFSIRDDEDIILAENQQSLQKLIDAMKRAQGRKVFFILVPGFPLNALIQAGFVFNRDFLNGFEFLPIPSESTINFYPLIKTM